MKNIIGKKGGSSGKAYNPVEDRNSLRSNSIARIVDVISEGEIEGFVTSDKDKSIYIDQIPLKGDDGYNFNGITTVLKEGLPDQTYIPGFSAESEQAVGIKLTYNIPTTKTITNTNVDECIVTVRVPALMEQKDNGDIKKTSVKFRIEINNTLVGDKTIHGKCTSEYLKSYRLPLLENFGAGPWEIKLTRLTADSSSPKLANDLYWNTYTELINEKIPYNDTALVAFTADAQQFGGRMPQRLYYIKGIKVRIPSNYDPETREYDGVWDGTFKIDYTNNPAWIYYDLLYSERYGCGFEKDIGDGNYFIDKWELYTIAQNCDVLVDDGKGGTEPRFTFNSVINTREQAQVVLTSLASTFRAKPFWYTGLATLSQDRPKDPVKVVTNADVIDGIFQYSGSSLKDRVTCVNVSWNDPDDFYKPAVEVIEDQDGIARYGFNSIDIAAYGCTSRAQARRFGKWYLYTELQQTTTVEYSASFDHFQLIPGDIIIVNDEHYITKKLGGRIKSATTTEIVLDRNVTLESGKTYTIAMEGPQGQLARADILNSPETTDTLSISTIAEEDIPQNWAVFSINSDSFDERQFQIVNMEFKEDNVVNIKALLYDADKFDAVDSGIYFDEKHYSDVEEGALLPPTNLSAEEYSYVSNQTDFVGLLLSWQHPADARINRYEIQWKDVEGAWSNLGQTEQNYFDIRPVDTGDYLLRVRSKSISNFSVWSDEFAVSVTWNFDAPADITGLQVRGGGSTFTGRDIEIEWDAYDMTLGKFDKYIVRVYTTSDVLLRTLYTAENNYIYTEQMSIEDNGTPQRNIKFKVVVVDIYNNESNNPAVLTTSNPIPSMASIMPTIINLFKGLKITWSSVSDNDMESYKIYLDKSNPPTTEIAEVGANTNSWIEVELDSDDIYYVQIEPYDCFGVGTKSQVANGKPLVLPHDGINVELSSTIEISDYDDNSAETLSKLYDGNKLSDGITYSLSGTDKWIEYKFPVEYIMDNMTAWFADTNAHVYIGYKRGESDSWHYLKAESDHTLDSDGRMLTASNLSDAQTNYLNTTSGINRALFPQALVATECRIFFTGSYTTTIYELRFIREVIAEQIVADNLSSISANVGAIEAGTIQSQNYDNNNGILIDLNGDAFKCGGNTDPKFHWNGPAGELNIKAKVAFESGTTGYDNTDGPQNLQELDSNADDKLDTAYSWGYDPDTTKIDGGNLYVGSSVRLDEGGKIHCGDNNILINTENDVNGHGYIVVADDGGVDADGQIADGKNYLIIDAGEIKTYKWFNAAHREFKTLAKVRVGTSANGDTVDLGYFPNEPKIILSPADLQCYDGAYNNQDQSFKLHAKNITQDASGAWSFEVEAQLVLASAGGSETVGFGDTNAADGSGNLLSTSTVTTPANTNRVTAHIRIKTIHSATTNNTYHYRKVYYRLVIGGTNYSWHSSDIGNTLDFVSFDFYEDISTAGSYSVKVEAYCGDRSGTFTVGSPGYDYSTTASQNDPDCDTGESSFTIPSGQGGTVGETIQGVYFTWPTPSKTSGWELYKYKQEAEFRYKAYGNVSGTGANARVWNKFRAVKGNGYTWDWENNFGCYSGVCGLDDLSLTDSYDSGKITASSYTAGQGEIYVRTYGYCSSAPGDHVTSVKGQTDVTLVKTTFYLRKLKTHSVYTSNELQWDSYDYQLSTATVLADGSINYIAIDGGE